MVADLKTLTWQMLAGLYYYSGLPRISHRGRVVILTYHRVASDDMVRTAHIQPGMYVRPETFEAHAAYLKKRFVVLPLQDLFELWRDDRLDRRKAYCVITFDDGWQDNYRYAFPVLKRHGLPATIFLATDYIGTSRWFWPDQIAYVLYEAKEKIAPQEVQKALGSILANISRASESLSDSISTRIGSNGSIDSDALIESCKRLKPEAVHELVHQLSRTLRVDLPTRRVLLDWEEVREMAGSGISFGSHSASHGIMVRMSTAEVEKELVDSWQAMLQHGIKPIPIFCYPNGDFNRNIQALVKANGYLGAVGCEVGSEDFLPQDRFALKRISLHEDSAASSSLLALALSGFR